jgi:hypothetical protein
MIFIVYAQGLCMVLTDSLYSVPKKLKQLIYSAEVTPAQPSLPRPHSSLTSSCLNMAIIDLSVLSQPESKGCSGASAE